LSYPKHPLSALGNIQTGSTPSTSEESFWGGEYPFVTPAELDDIHPIIETPRTLSNAGASQSRLLQEGAVMVCCIGSLGKIGIAGRSLVTNQQINSIEFDCRKVYPRYGFYACQRLKPKLLSMAPATTIPIVSKSKFGQLEIPLPPLPEQRRIAAILDKADALRAKRREALAQLDELTQSIFIEMFGHPVKNELCWPKKQLRELGRVVTGRTPSSSKEGMFGGHIPFITPGDLESDEPIKRTVTEFGASEVEVVREGATLVCCIGTIGKMGVAKVRSAFNQQINAIEWGQAINDEYGLAALKFFRNTLSLRATLTTVPILNKSNFEKLELPVPPLTLQVEFSEKSTHLNNQRKLDHDALRASDALFTSLQHRAFRGDL
jgi:type I restriction enzyme S subunit